jgi:putative membrane protein
MEVDRDQALLQAIQERVAGIEEATRVDVVITIVPHSGSYDDVYLQVGVGLAFAALLAILFTPWRVHELGIPVDLLASFVIGAGLARRSPAVVRALTSSARRRRQVRHSAAAAMHTSHVTETAQRTGLLVHLSALEQDAVVIPDTGLAHSVPAETWKELEHSLDGPLHQAHPHDALLAALDHMRDVLAKVCPATGAAHCLPTAPQVLES